ncbi:hypothetical protein [Paenibacillus sp. SN-8-1]
MAGLDGSGMVVLSFVLAVCYRWQAEFNYIEKEVKQQDEQAAGRTD